MTLKERLADDVKAAMKGGFVDRRDTVRLIQSAIKQVEIDSRTDPNSKVDLDDTQVLGVLEKMLKQRRDSISQYDAANRQDLADVERQEVVVLQTYLPQALTQAEIAALLDKAVADAGATGIKDMGKVMAVVKPLVVGRADMGSISALIKARLGG